MPIQPIHQRESVASCAHQDCHAQVDVVVSASEGLPASLQAIGWDWLPDINSKNVVKGFGFSYDFDCFCPKHKDEAWQHHLKMIRGPRSTRGPYIA